MVLKLQSKTIQVRQNGCIDDSRHVGGWCIPEEEVAIFKQLTLIGHIEVEK